MKILIISLLIIVIFLIVNGSTFANSPSNTTYILDTPGFGYETYTLPDLTSSNITLNDQQYLVFVKYMNVPKIANFMSDNSQVNSTELGNFIGVSTKGVPSIISGNTISYNQAIGINSGTSTGVGQNNPPTPFQIDRTLLILDVIDSITNLYCSNTDANRSDESSSNQYITNCVRGDIKADLERFYYIKSTNELSLEPLSLDYPTYMTIANALANRYSVFVDRLDPLTYDKL